jgi:hypothetical protein
MVTGNSAFLALYRPMYNSSIGKTDIRMRVFIFIF